MGALYKNNQLLNYAALGFRQLTCRFRRLPDFMIIGAQKSGTTAMFSFLAQHPQLAVNKLTSVHYFDLNYSKSLCFYKRNFPLKWFSKNKLVGEYTPFYVFHPLAVERIGKDFPHMKLIILMRNPVDRAYSHYNMKCERGEETETFEKALELEESRTAGEVEKIKQDHKYISWSYRAFTYKERGIYADQVERVYRYFPKDQVLILQSEQYFKNHLESIKQIYDFLGISYFEPQNLNVRNKREYPKPMSEETRNALNSYFFDHNERLFKLIGKRFSWNDWKKNNI